MSRVNRCIVTGANSVGRDKKQYFEFGLKTLIASIHKYGYDEVDKILVCDFGLKVEHVDYLNIIEKVEIVNLPDNVNSYFDDLNIRHYKYYAYRSWLMTNLKKYAKYAVWLDSGVCLCSNPKPIFDTIKNFGMFLVEMDSNWQITRDGISPETFNKFVDIISATEEELNSTYTFGGMHGVDTDSLQYLILNEVYKYSKIRDCIYSDNIRIHRQQTILSILTARYNVPRQSHIIYGNHLGMNHVPDQILYTHRCNHGNPVSLSNIRFKGY